VGTILGAEEQAVQNFHTVLDAAIAWGEASIDAPSKASE
jgi:hypothetical protein